MHLDKITVFTIRTYEAAIRKQVCYPLHLSATSTWLCWLGNNVCVSRLLHAAVVDSVGGWLNDKGCIDLVFPGGHPSSTSQGRCRWKSHVSQFAIVLLLRIQPSISDDGIPHVSLYLLAVGSWQLATCWFSFTSFTLSYIIIKTASNTSSSVDFLYMFDAYCWWSSCSFYCANKHYFQLSQQSVLLFIASYFLSPFSFTVHKSPLVALTYIGQWKFTFRSCK